MISGSANIKAIKRAFDDVSAAVKAMQERERKEKLERERQQQHERTAPSP